MQGNAAREMAFKKIEEKLMAKGINLAVLDNQELAAVALQFTGEAPPDHLPRETIIEILSGQESVQNWAASVKEKIGSSAPEVVKSQIRDQVKAAQSKASSRTENDPIAAQMTQRFGVWLKESGYTSTQLTQMLDANVDGFISSEEATNLIRKLSNSEPPKWAVNHVLKAMDANGDGQLSVPEWWEFLESIGVEVNKNPTADDSSDLKQDLLVEKNDERKSSRVIDEAERRIAEVEAEVRKKTAEKKAEAEEAQKAALHKSEAERQAKQAAQKAAQDLEAKQSSDDVNTPSPSDSMFNQNGVQEESLTPKNSTELMIELLEKTRLSSESADVIKQSVDNTCAITVEEISRTLLGSGQYRGGCTIQGKIDGGFFSAGIMFPVSENELIESFKQGILITCQGKIAKWSSGSRQATLEGRNPVFD